MGNGIGGIPVHVPPPPGPPGPNPFPLPPNAMAPQPQQFNLQNITVSAQSQLIDRDPITAGIQSHPGVVRPVGPPQFIGNMAGSRPRPPVMVNQIRR